MHDAVGEGAAVGRSPALAEIEELQMRDISRFDNKCDRRAVCGSNIARKHCTTLDAAP